MAHQELPNVLQLLCSNQSAAVEQAKKTFHEYFNSTKDAFLVNGMVDFYVATECYRCVDILVGVREAHVTHFFNKMAECLRNTTGQAKLSVLTLLSHVVMRQPTWLYKIANHGLFRELLKVLKTENEIVNLVSAVLTFVILLPMIPAYVGGALPEIFEVFSRLAAWNTTNPTKLPSDQLVHLQISLHFLFYRLYGMYPCNFLSYLRQQYGARENLIIFSHTIKPMLETVKMHPLLVTTSKELETTTTRWKTMEHHDVVVECAKLSVDAKDDNIPTALATFRARSESELRRMFEATGYQELKTLNSHGSETKDLWSGGVAVASVPATPQPLEVSAPTTIPLTPVAQVHINNASFPHEIGTSPPEAAVEATPETTPVKDPRVYATGRASLPHNPAVIRAIGEVALSTPRYSLSSTPTNSQPSSPLKKEHSPFRLPESEEACGDVMQRKMRAMMQERVTAQGERKRCSTNGVMDTRALDQDEQDDQEVIQISQQGELSIGQLGSVRQCDSVLQDFHPGRSADIEEEEEELESDSPSNSGLFRAHMNLRNRLRYYSQCHSDSQPSSVVMGSSDPLSNGMSLPYYVRRAYSCPEIKKERKSFTAAEKDQTFDETLETEPLAVSQGTQTEENVPPLYPYDHMLLGLIPPAVAPLQPSQATPRSSPSLLLDQYLEVAAARPSLSDKTVRDQLNLLHLQLKFERHRRDIHAERNRRLLGKSRNNRWLEEHNIALKDQLRILQLEMESLRGEVIELNEDRKTCERLHQSKLQHWMDQSDNFEKQNRELKAENQRLLLELQSSSRQNITVNKQLQQAQAMCFGVGGELQAARAHVSQGEALRAQVTSLQRELVVMGERASKNSSNLALLAMCSNKGKDIAMVSYSHQLNKLTSQLEGRSSNCEALKARVGELEAAIARKDKYIAEQKRILKATKEESREELEAVETKYKSEVSTNRKLECTVLELSSKLESAGRRPRRNVSAAQDALSLAERGGINSPLSLSLSSSEGLSMASTLTTDNPPRDLQAVLDAPEPSTIPEIPEFDDLAGPSGDLD